VGMKGTVGSVSTVGACVAARTLMQPARTQRAVAAASWLLPLLLLLLLLLLGFLSPTAALPGGTGQYCPITIPGAHMKTANCALRPPTAYNPLSFPPSIPCRRGARVRVARLPDGVCALRARRRRPYAHHAQRARRSRRRVEACASAGQWAAPPPCRMPCTLQASMCPSTL
jgi:hypothetical protein